MSWQTVREELLGIVKRIRKLAGQKGVKKRGKLRRERREALRLLQSMFTVARTQWNHKGTVCPICWSEDFMTCLSMADHLIQAHKNIVGFDGEAKELLQAAAVQAEAARLFGKGQVPENANSGTWEAI